MASKRKPLNEQTIVLTGATSGIGLATARQAAEAGARLVLAARDEDALARLADELRARGAHVATVTADVGAAADVARIADTAREHYGQLDTWVNNAGTSVHGASEQVALDDMRRVMQTNFWGVVNGSLEAVKLMKAHGGGVIVNVGSETSDRAVPLQGTDAASRHAVKAFTESLRMELAREGAAIDLTLVKPASMATPFPAPELVAQAILRSAVQPRRDITVGGRAKLMAVAGYLAPRSVDRAMRAGLPPRAAERSPATAPALHPAARTLLLGGALLAAWAVARRPARRAGRA